MKDIIKQKVLSKNWSFSEVSDLSNSIGALAKEIYIELSLTERFNLVREIRINDNMLGRPFEDIFRDIGLIQIQADVAEVIKQMLSTATVNFGGNNNEISERSLGGKSNQERPSDGKKDSSDQRRLC